MRRMIRTWAAGCVLAGGLLAGAAAVADPGFSDKPHKMVIQVDSADPALQNLALNNAVNLQKLRGMDDVAIEVVAYGPGLTMLLKNPKNKLAARVNSLALQDISFSACGNTMAKMEKKTGKKLTLLAGAHKVTAGVGRILDLEEHGYAYLRP